MSVYHDWTHSEGIKLTVDDNGDSISLVMQYRDDTAGVVNELGMLIDPADTDKLIAELQDIKIKYEASQRRAAEHLFGIQMKPRGEELAELRYVAEFGQGRSSARLNGLVGKAWVTTRVDGKKYSASLTVLGQMMLDASPQQTELAKPSDPFDTVPGGGR